MDNKRRRYEVLHTAADRRMARKYLDMPLRVFGTGHGGYQVYFRDEVGAYAANWSDLRVLFHGFATLALQQEIDRIRRERGVA